MIQFKEIETKYSAENISLKAFQAFCEKRKPLNKVVASGYDRFYSKPSEPGTFCRHRQGPDLNQLSFKRKTTDANSYIRTEHNLDLQPGISIEQVSALCAEFGYKYNTSIFKTCFVYQYGWYSLVYYVCYTQDMNELGRFMEIEMSEDEHWRSENEAWSELRRLETECTEIGAAPSARHKKSLYEMFKKEEV